MTGSESTYPSATLQQRRLLAVAWVGIVLLVGACLFLGTWWSSNRAQTPPSPTALEMAGLATPLQTRAVPMPAVTAAPTRGADVPVITPVDAVIQPTPTPPPIVDPSFGYGVIIDGRYQQQQTLTQVQQLGMGWVRQTVRWSEVEPAPGDRQWQQLDAVFEATAAHNLKVLVTVLAAPDWARSVTAEGYDGPPDDVSAYVSFVTQLIQRYRGAIHAVEVWSNMNEAREWYVAGGLSAAAYMNLLRQTTAAVHQEDPGIIVISGGLNPTGVNDGIVAMDDFRYMEEMIAAGLLDVVDCVGVHHQGYNLPPDMPYEAVTDDPAILFQQPVENPHHSWSFYSTVRGYHDMIVAARREVPLCVTEFGWPAIGQQRGDPAPEFVYDNSLEEQAEYTVQAFTLMHQWGFVWLAFINNLVYFDPDAAAPPETLALYYRVTSAEGLPRPAFDALAEMPKLP